MNKRLASFKKPWRVEDDMIVDADGAWVARLAGSCSREDDELLATHICECVNSVAASETPEPN